MARRPSQPPVVTDERHGGLMSKKMSHPAFAQIGASRVSGGTTLYGSDFVHRDFIEIRIAESDQYRDLSHDWHHERKPIVQVRLSAAQWATFVSTLNHGSGVPCTLTLREGDWDIPSIEITETARDQFRREFAEDIDDARRAMRDALALAQSELTESMPAKRRKQLQFLIATAQRALESNSPFVVTSFDEHMDRVVEKAKMEAEAYVTSVVQRAGIAALQSDTSGELLKLAAAPTEREDER